LLNSLSWGSWASKGRQDSPNLMEAQQPWTHPGEPASPTGGFGGYPVGHFFAQFVGLSAGAVLSSSSSSQSPCREIHIGILIQQIHAETGLPVNELQALAAKGLLEQIPRNEVGELTSRGSIEHTSGTCSPCIFWYKKACVKGLFCSYCHIRHPGQKSKRIRPSKKTRMQRRGLLEEQANTKPAEEASQGGGEEPCDEEDEPTVEETTSAADGQQVKVLDLMRMNLAEAMATHPQEAPVPVLPVPTLTSDLRVQILSGTHISL